MPSQEQFVLPYVPFPHQGDWEEHTSYFGEQPGNLPEEFNHEPVA